MFLNKIEELSGTALWIKDNFEALFLWFCLVCIAVSTLFILKLYMNRQQ